MQPKQGHNRTFFYNPIEKDKVDDQFIQDYTLWDWFHYIKPNKKTWLNKI